MGPSARVGGADERKAKALRDRGDLANGSFRFQKSVPGTKKSPRWGAERRAGPRHGPAIPSTDGRGLAVRRANGCGASAPANFGAPLPSFRECEGFEQKFGTTARRDAPRGNAPA